MYFKKQFKPQKSLQNPNIRIIVITQTAFLTHINYAILSLLSLRIKMIYN